MMPDIEPCRTLERISIMRAPFMRTTLLIAGLAGLLATAAPPTAEAGPGRTDIDRMSRARTIPIGGDEDGRSAEHGWDQGYVSPWPFYPGYGYPARDRDRHGQGYYGYPWPVWPHYGYGPFGRFQPLPGSVIRYRLQRQYFHGFRHWKFVNGYYRVYAEDRYGRDVRLIVDPYTGRVLEAQRRR
jgi:hypothetical protein